MRFFRLLVLICVASIGNLVMAQSQEELGQLMRNRNEYYFTLAVDKPAEIRAINEICSVDAVKGNTIVCYANQKQYEKLLEAGYNPQLQTPPCMLEETVMWDGSNRASYEWDSYPTYDAYQSMMEAFPSQALSDRTCTLLDLGTLNSGRKILGVRLNKGNPDGKPKFLYSSTMHGDEVTGMMLMLRLIDEFCTSEDSRIVNILENVDLFIFPLTNPDGTYYGGNSTMNQARRYNINGTDLNRNYKDYYNGDHPDGEAWALETQWTMQLAQDYLFTMSANYHGGAEVMNYPWDAVYTDHPDKAWWQLISAEYVSNARVYSSSYMTDTYSSGVTNGASWYVITGSRQDYENAYGECREITIECSSTKKPSASNMPTYWNYNHTAMLAFIEQCTKGVHGFVYDAVTGASLEGVTVTVENHDNSLSTVTTHNVGDFHRPIKGGTYTFTFTKEGYYPKSEQVTVADGERVELNNVLLNPISWTITATADPTEGGIIEGAGNYATGETCTLTATAAENYQFIHWTENSEVVSTNASYSFEVTADRNLVAVFASTDPISITASANPARAGSVNGGGNYLYGETCTVTAIPNEGYSFINWTENGTVVSEDLAYTFMVSAERNLVANFTFMAAVSGHCYYPVNNISAGSYVMGYRNGTTIYTLSQSNTSVTTTSATVSPTDYGFSVEGETTLPQVTLTAYGNNGQYYIMYNNRYLTRSNNTLTWNTSQNNSSSRWYINANGIYLTVSSGWSGSTNYYLYYNNGSFQLSTNSQNNISFYTEGNCQVPEFTITATVEPTDGGTVEGSDIYFEGETCTLTATANDGYTFVNWTESGVEVSSEATYAFEVTADRELVANFEENVTTATQTITFNETWGWWSTYLDIDLEQLEEALGTAGVAITSQENGFTSNYSGIWAGGLQNVGISVSQMYRIQLNDEITITLNAAVVNPTDYPITLNHGVNWIGYPVAHSMSLDEAFAGANPVNGDMVSALHGSAQYYNGAWYGELQALMPGQGYIYTSNATETKTFTYPTR